MSDLEKGGEEDELPKIHRFTSDLSNWLTVLSIVLFVVYGILTLVYEIVLDLTHVRKAFFGFLICCAVDVVSYWICRFAVQESGGGEKCLLSLVLITQFFTGLYYLIAPIIVLCTFRFIPEVSATQNNRTDDNISDAAEEYEEQFYHTFEEYVNPDPCSGGISNRNADPMWQCGYVQSIKIASWWMMTSVIPKFLICYLILRILKMLKNK